MRVSCGCSTINSVERPAKIDVEASPHRLAPTNRNVTTAFPVYRKADDWSKMSIEIMNAVWKHSKSEGRARLVLLAIADHQGEIGAWPSIETLAKMVNASTRSVKRDIQELVELGELVVELQNAPIKTQYKPNLYWVTISGVTDSSSGVTDLTSGVTGQVNRGDTVGTQNLNITIKEPLLKTISNKGTRFSVEATLDSSWLDWCLQNRPDLNPQQTFEAFKDYWISATGRNATKLDWEATWRNWCRNQRKQSTAFVNQKRTAQMEAQEKFLKSFETVDTVVVNAIEWGN